MSSNVLLVSHDIVITSCHFSCVKFYPVARVLLPPGTVSLSVSDTLDKQAGYYVYVCVDMTDFSFFTHTLFSALFLWCTRNAFVSSYNTVMSEEFFM